MKFHVVKQSMEHRSGLVITVMRLSQPHLSTTKEADQQAERLIDKFCVYYCMRVSVVVCVCARMSIHVNGYRKHGRCVDLCVV